MPPYEIEYLATLRTMYARLSASFHFAEHDEAFRAALLAALDASPPAITLLLDLYQREFHIEDIIAGTALSTQGERAFLRHPHLARILLVPEAGAFKLAASLMNSGPYANLPVRLFEFSEEALAFLESEAKGGPD